MNSVMQKFSDTSPNAAPAVWDRSGLPAWTYYSEELVEVEKDALFRRHWQIACHISDVPESGNFIAFDMCGERAIVMRDMEGGIRAFHNLCRHRGARVLGEAQGTCPHVITCPFHGWTYNLDGTLRRAAVPDSLPDLDPVEHGLKQIECEIWHGFVFLRFLPGDQPSVAEIFARHEAEVAPYRMADMVPAHGGFWKHEMAVNWKSVRDVDNEGYHVAKAHPGLQALYGSNYFDEPLSDGTSRSFGTFSDHPGKSWSVSNYKAMLPQVEHLPPESQRAWLYLGLFPNAVIGFYPTSVIFYQEFPISARRTLQRGATYRYAEESREMRVSRYLAERIDRETQEEDIQLIKWSCEATDSSAYDGIILSDREYNVRCYHDAFRDQVPVMKLDRAPAPNTMATVNREMKQE